MRIDWQEKEKEEVVRRKELERRGREGKYFIVATFRV